MLIMSTALLGCLNSGVRRDFSDRVTIQTKSLPPKECRLLSVRADTAFVLIEQEEPAYDDKIAYSHAFIIKRDSIISLQCKGHGGSINEAVFSLVGDCIGLVIGLQLWTLDSYNVVFKILPLVAGCSFVGSLIGSVLPAPVDIKLSDPEEIRYLRSISTFPDKEPPEMQYIR